MDLINEHVCIVTDNNIQIKDSYTITSKSEMSEILYALEHFHPECNVFKRNHFSLICEWKTHNRLYKLGLWKNHTKDVDLNYPLKWYMKVLYVLFGIW